jgi:nucleotide-binding universal stress UspA family protein
MDILLATDFSGRAGAAAHVAADYARRLGARLHLLHVTWPGVDDRVPERLARIADDIAPDLKTIVAVRIGRAAREIIAYANTHRVELIVMGTHGRTGVSRVLTGSVAEQVVRTAACPVLTVPLRGHADAPVAAAPPLISRCLTCARETDDLICDTCRVRIRGEALERKQEAAKPGRDF